MEKRKVEIRYGYIEFEVHDDPVDLCGCTEESHHTRTIPVNLTRQAIVHTDCVTIRFRSVSQHGAEKFVLLSAIYTPDSSDIFTVKISNEFWTHEKQYGKWADDGYGKDIIGAILKGVVKTLTESPPVNGGVLCFCKPVIHPVDNVPAFYYFDTQRIVRFLQQDYMNLSDEQIFDLF